MAKEDEGLFEQLRNSVIHCFEFTYELSHKMLKRYLEETAANPEEVDFSTFENSDPHRQRETFAEVGLDALEGISAGKDQQQPYL